jgi:hypothetical protein
VDRLSVAFTRLEYVQGILARFTANWQTYKNFDQLATLDGLAENLDSTSLSNRNSNPQQL